MSKGCGIYFVKYLGNYWGYSWNYSFFTTNSMVYTSLRKRTFCLNNIFKKIVLFTNFFLNICFLEYFLLNICYSDKMKRFLNVANRLTRFKCRSNRAKTQIWKLNADCLFRVTFLHEYSVAVSGEFWEPVGLYPPTLAPDHREYDTWVVDRTKQSNNHASSGHCRR